MKDLEVEQRVNRSKAVGDARVAKMNARDLLLEVSNGEDRPNLKDSKSCYLFCVF